MHPITVCEVLWSHQPNSWAGAALPDVLLPSMCPDGGGSGKGAPARQGTGEEPGPQLLVNNLGSKALAALPRAVGAQRSLGVRALGSLPIPAFWNSVVL